ncbi:hypothetical protein [Flavobacterium sp. HNIBRBA15423]|uniref:hypothetical protein n=1 Tax=Flavobacterium sp. HNIBRBA15423 TaxID=3458683 RepID=UPI004043C835
MRKHSLFVFIGVLLFTFTNCEYEEKISDYQSNHNSEQQLKVSKVNFNQFKKNKNLMEKLGKFTNTSQQTLEKLVYSNDNSFYVDTDFAYFIENENGKHSYTFQIIRQNSQYLLENLIINQNDSLGYNLFIAQYNINELELDQLSNGENPNIIDKLNIIPLSNNIINTSSLLSRGSVEGMCLTETIIPGNTCPGTEHHNLDDVLGGAFCPYFANGSFTLYKEQIIYSWGPCGQDTSGGGNYGDDLTNPGGGFPTGSGDGNPTGGSSGTGNSTGSPDNTNPNPDNSFEDTQDPVLTTPTIATNVRNNPCNEISKVIEKPQFSTNMQTLKSNISGTKEKGFIIRDKYGADAFSEIVEGDDDGNVTYPYADTTIADLDNLFKSIGTAHNHIATINTQIGIFTPEDLANLMLNGLLETHLQNPNRSETPKKSIIFVITDKGLFSLKINNLTKLQAFCVDYGSWTKQEAEKYMNDIFQDPEGYNILPTSTHDEQVTGFLRFMQDQDIGVDLYEGNADTFGEWKKLNLTENNGVFSFTETPCNN